MDTFSPAEVAARLGTSRKRVVATARKAGLVVAEPGTRVRFTADEVERMESLLGCTPRVGGLSRSEEIVLAELARRPLGLVSARAVARACGISPTTASRTVAALEAEGLLVRERSVRALGAARDVEMIRANVRHPRWSSLLPSLLRVRRRVAPEHAGVRPPSGLPAYLRHAFWNADDAAFRGIDVGRDATYIADRALTTGDPELLAFAAAFVPARGWREAAGVRGRSPEDRALAMNIARSR